MSKTDEQNAGQVKAEAAIVKMTADFGDVYMKVTPDGQILRPIKGQMRLHEKLGHFYKMFAGKKAGGGEDEDRPAAGPTDENEKFKFPILAAGFTHLNKVAGISILTPRSVIVDGREQPNPYVERADKTKAITSVIIRKIGIGYAPSGAIVAMDKTLFYNTYTYFIQAIQAKMKEKIWYNGPDKGKPKNPNAAVYGTEKEDPAKATGSPHPGRWAFFPTEPPLGIWINYDDPAILECMSEHTQRQRFGDRIAQRIVERNVLKDHPAIGVAQVFAKKGTAGLYADVQVFGFRHDLMPPQLSAMVQQIEAGAETAAFEVRQGVDVETDLDEERAAVADISSEEQEIDRRAIHKEDDPEIASGKDGAK